MKKIGQLLIVLASLLLFACGGQSSPLPGEDSETHFLGYCSGDTCADGLSCICGICTVTCDPAKSCSDLNEQALCRAGDAMSNDAFMCDTDSKPSVCDVSCKEDDDCDTLGNGYACVGGSCRGAAASCAYEGKRHDAGDSFPSKDGCNTCSCSEDGSVVCTEKDCVDAGPGGGCAFNSEMHAPGDSWMAPDGCNTCSCSEDGSVACTDKACPGGGMGCEQNGVMYKDGEALPNDDDCGGCFCEDGSIQCLAIACFDCTEDGKGYFEDEPMPSDDCNACVCGPEGEKLCDAAECTPGVCALPFEIGPCDAAIQVFWFNAMTGECEEQTYGGCQGNDNRFETLEACQMACGAATAGIGCEVNAERYAHGASVPDPYSCNTCTCDNGTVTSCTEIGCPLPCEEGTRPGRDCAQCGPTDACEVLRTGCLPECDEDTDCEMNGGICDMETGTCPNLCG